jgi:plastocyanin
MTTHDENHITRTTPKRFMKGLIIIVIPLIFLGSITIVYWNQTASIPPPVSAPPPAPPPAPVNAPGAASETTSSGTTTTTAPNAAAPASAGPSITIPAGAATPGNPAYAPDTLTVKRGDVITVTNDDTAPHTATSGSGPEDPNSAQLFDTSIIMAGDTAQIDTNSLEPGDYAYHCTVHPFMKGTITVQ